jgi:hypothetical protein
MAINLKPPADPPLLGNDSQHSTAWADYHDRVAAALKQLGTGVTDGSDAPAGQVGERLTASGGPIGLTSNAAANIATLPLTAGDFEVWGNIHFTAAPTTHPTEAVAGVSSASGALGAVYEQVGAPFNAGANIQLGTGGPVRFSSAGAQTAYLVAFAVFTAAGMTASGTIWARRVR